MPRNCIAVYLCALFCSFGASGESAISKAVAKPNGLEGGFTIITTRRASDVAGGPIEHEAAARVGEQVTFGQSLTWWDGRICKTWSAAPSDEPVLPTDDPLLSDTQIPPVDGPASSGDRRLNQHWRLACDGKPLGVLLQVDQRVLVIPTPSGVTNLVLERPLEGSQVRAFQTQLKSMKFYSGAPSEQWDDASLSGVGSYAEYRGAAYRFARAAITENLLDGLRVLDSGAAETSQTRRAARSQWDDLKIVISEDIEAHFRGEKVPLAPLTHGVKELYFTFNGDPARYSFKPEGELYFSDWTFDIFSPEATYVTLLQDHYGPYHLIHRDRLKEYLLGRAKPDHVVGSKESPAAVHSGLRWIDKERLEYKTACCGTSETHTYLLRFPDYRPKTSPDTLHDYRPSLSAQVAGLPEAEIANLKRLLNLLNDWTKKATENPGRWEEGNVALGADPKEYVPSDAELVAGEIGDRIARIAKTSTAQQLTDELVKLKTKEIHVLYTHFEFRHVDVMGSGRFFYATPQAARIILGTPSKK